MTLHVHAAAQHLDKVGDDVALEDFGVVGFEAVENLAAHRHNALEAGVAGVLAGTGRRIALHDVQLPLIGVFGAAVDEFVDAGGDVHVGREVLLDSEALFFRLFAALFVEKHLPADFVGFEGILNEPDFKLMAEKFGHRLLDKLVGNRLFGLIFVAGLVGEGGHHDNQTVLHVLKRDLALVLGVFAGLLEPRVDHGDKRAAHSLLRRAAVFQPARIVVVFGQRHAVGERHRRVDFDIVFGLVVAVASAAFTLPILHL